MDPMNAVEWFGLAASVIVAYSLMLKDMLRLRCWNLLGALMFSVYGGLIGALPVLVLNVFISIADVYYIVKIRQAVKSKR